ncbi:MAG: beta-galactosidase, partial [Clostridia bacterium]|nr:beta-galactosidase [Clostridia bacterium]
MNFRQVHLDFHTSELIPGVGSEFSKENFQKALKKGHVNSITLFSKCHHGWAYHPSKANEMHPTLTFDLLGAQIEAAHEIGVRTPVYLSAGLDEKMARR